MSNHDFPRLNLADIERLSEERNSLLATGGNILDFFQKFTQRDPVTKKLDLKEGANITVAVADFYLPHLVRVEKLNRAVSDYPSSEIDLSPQAAFSVTPEELTGYRHALEFRIALQGLIDLGM